MSVWHIKTIDPGAKLSTTALIVVAMLVIGLSLHSLSSVKQRTASTLNALDAADSITPLPTEGEFAAAQQIDWEGYIRRSLAGGEGLEVVSQDAPGGTFQAYVSDGAASVSEGPVRVRGFWHGYTCAYGGNDGRCVPDVTISDIERLPIAPE